MRNVGIRLGCRPAPAAGNRCQYTPLSLQALLPTLIKPMLQRIICASALASTECKKYCTSSRMSVLRLCQHATSDQPAQVEGLTSVDSISLGGVHALLIQ